MATGTAGDNAQRYHTRQVHYLRKRVTFADYGTTVTVGTIPAGASVIGGGIHIVTAFNSSGTDLVDVGYVGATTVAAAYASALTMAAVGFIVLDELATTTNIQGTVTHRVTAALTQSVADATTGVGDIIIMYVPADQ